MSAPVEIARPVWSKSKMAALRECRRKVHFLSLQPAPRLKNLKNRHLWTAGAIHDAVGEILKTVRQGQAVPSVEELLASVKERMRADFKNSKGSPDGKWRLFEHEYGIQVSGDAWQQHWLAIEKSLGWFLSSSWLKRLQSFGPENWKAVDEILEFDVNGVKAYVKIDCAVEVNGRFVLIDWKTSRVQEKDLQPLQVAALYAHEVWGAEPEQIDAMTMSLRDGAFLKADVNEESLMEAHLKIEEEAALLSSELENPVEDPLSLPPAPAATCMQCNFQKLCFPSGVV